jgi:CDP-diacylglycerol---glycerol-3-phosphate 3-phosphatidyltransferase
VKPLGLGWPNVISVLRALLVPVLVLLILVDTRAASIAAAAVFAVGAASDGLDGYLSRRHSMKTSTGAWLDPLSDKLLISAPIVVLAVRGDFPIWAAVIIVGREVAVSLLRAYLGSQSTSMPASWLGKLKTVSQIAVVALYLLPLGTWAEGLRLAVLVAAVALTLISGLDYFVSSRSRVKGA